LESKEITRRLPKLRMNKLAVFCNGWALQRKFSIINQFVEHFIEKRDS
jgi:hypothetical protein